jgi:hypothetical protein
VLLSIDLALSDWQAEDESLASLATLAERAIRIKCGNSLCAMILSQVVLFGAPFADDQAVSSCRFRGPSRVWKTERVSKLE